MGSQDIPISSPVFPDTFTGPIQSDQYKPVAAFPSPLSTNPDNWQPMQSTQHRAGSPLRSPQPSYDHGPQDEEPFIIAANAYIIDPLDPALYSSMNWNNFDQLVNKVKTFAISSKGKNADEEEEDEIDNMIYTGAFLEEDNDTDDERAGKPTKIDRRNATLAKTSKKDIRVRSPSQLARYSTHTIRRPLQYTCESSNDGGGSTRVNQELANQIADLAAYVPAADVFRTMSYRKAAGVIRNHPIKITDSVMAGKVSSSSPVRRNNESLY